MLIDKIRDFQSFEKLKDWNEILLSTPIHKFYTYFNSILIDGYLITTVIRDKKDDVFLVDFLKQISSIVSISKTIIKISNLTFENSKMDGVIILPSLYHNEFYTVDEKLHKQTILVLPIHHSEFSDDESTEEFNILRNNYITTIDWERDIVPRIKIRFKNSITKNRTTGKGFCFCTLKDLKSELQGLKDSESFIELKNYKQIFIRILYTKTKIEVFNENKILIFTGKKKESYDFIYKFLTE